MKSIDYKMDFESAEEAIDAYSLTKLPVVGQAYYAGYRIADDGRRVRIFARQHISMPQRFTFSERTEDYHA